MGKHEHQPLHVNEGRPLVLCLILTSTLFIVEVAGGLMSSSLALLSDAAHMLTDLVALAITFIAIKLGQRSADRLRTFGYYRLEILAAASNASLLFIIAFYILYEAYQRIYEPAAIHSNGMLAVASLGLIINVISIKLLKQVKDKNLGIKAAYFEVWSDMLGSIGVIVGSILIKITGWFWVDSIIAVGISIWILPRSWILLKESINILLEGVPRGVDLNKIAQSALDVNGVLDIHELHVWAIATNKISLTAHIVIDPNYNSDEVLANLRQLFVSRFAISHTTLQQEKEKCHDEEVNCNFSKKM